MLRSYKNITITPPITGSPFNSLVQLSIDKPLNLLIEINLEHACFGGCLLYNSAVMKIPLSQ